MMQPCTKFPSCHQLQLQVGSEPRSAASCHEYTLTTNVKKCTTVRAVKLSRSSRFTAAVSLGSSSVVVGATARVRLACQSTVCQDLNYSGMDTTQMLLGQCCGVATTAALDALQSGCSGISVARDATQCVAVQQPYYDRL
jgi:hypothetical protein